GEVAAERELLGERHGDDRADESAQNPERRPAGCHGDECRCGRVRCRAGGWREEYPGHRHRDAGTYRHGGTAPAPRRILPPEGPERRTGGEDTEGVEPIESVAGREARRHR